MVDIHIRDISDPVKRCELVEELIKKLGKTKLVFEAKIPNWHGADSWTIYGDFVWYPALPEGYSLVLPSEEEREILIKAKRYTVTNDYGTLADHETAKESASWWIRIKIRDLVNIYAQASVDPVVAHKQIEEKVRD